LVGAKKNRRGTTDLAEGCLRSRRNSIQWPALTGILLLLCAALGLADDKKPKPGQESFALIAGSVFREPGYALPDAKVVLMLKDFPKGKKLETLTSPRGEFTFRVPTASATYILKASFKGYRPEEKEAVVTGLDRVDVTFVLVPESK
jgi:hypothetical protein